MSEQKPQYRLKRSVFGRFVLQIKETRHHCKDLAGSGHYDEWTTEHWRGATLEEAIASGMTVS